MSLASQELMPSQGILTRSIKMSRTGGAGVSQNQGEQKCWDTGHDGAGATWYSESAVC